MEFGKDPLSPATTSTRICDLPTQGGSGQFPGDSERRDRGLAEAPIYTQLNVHPNPFQPGGGGGNMLPSRDFPMGQPGVHFADPEARVDYIPTRRELQEDYVEEYQRRMEPMMKDQDYVRKQKKSMKQYFMDEMQLPLLLAFMFFVFQMNFVSNLLRKYIPSFFNSDGTINNWGLGIKSIVFGGSYWGILKLVEDY